MAPTAALERGFGRTGLFYALFLPSLMGFVFLNRNKKKILPASVRVLGFVGILALSTVWWTACGSNSHTPSDPGTPVGASTVSVTATATSSGGSPITKQVTIALAVQ
jgi:hypothetical protein